MKILIVGLKKNPQLTRIIEEGQKRGHQVEGCFTSELVISAEKNSFKPTLRGRDIDHDLIYLWALGKRRWEWYTACLYLNRIKKTLIVNHKIVEKNYNYYLTPAIDYLRQVDQDLQFPKSAIVFSAESVDSVANEFSFPVIVKTSTGHQGRGVFRASTPGQIRKIIKDNREVSPAFIIRQFIPNDGDIRIFTVGYIAIGAMKRIPVRKGEFRSNISLGGRGEKFDLNKYPKVRKMAEKVSKVTRTEIAGVDIMLHKDTGEPYILEINPGPQFTGFEKYTGINTAGKIIKYFEHLEKK